MTTKTAEPPPPKGVSSKEWDRILQRGPSKATKMSSSVDVSRIRKLAERQKNAQAFEELTRDSELTAYDLVYESKVAAAQDSELLLTAVRMSKGVEEALNVYESLGGTYEPVV